MAYYVLLHGTVKAVLGLALGLAGRRLWRRRRGGCGSGERRARVERVLAREAGPRPARRAPRAARRCAVVAAGRRCAGGPRDTRHPRRERRRPRGSARAAARRALGTERLLARPALGARLRRGNAAEERARRARPRERSRPLPLLHEHVHRSASRSTSPTRHPATRRCFRHRRRRSTSPPSSSAEPRAARMWTRAPTSTR